MTTRRVARFGVGAVLLAVALSGCVSSPYSPPTVVVVSSPYVGTSQVVVDPLAQIGYQQGKVRVCSLSGGLLAVDVQTPTADSTTSLSVTAFSTDIETLGNVPEVRVLEASVGQGNVAVDMNFESSRPMRPGECADVSVRTQTNTLGTGPAFGFTVTW